MTPELMNKILSRANIGLWTIEMDENCEPRMYVNASMTKLLGIRGEYTPEEIYHTWYDRIHDGHREEVLRGINEIIRGKHAEIQYPWYHPYDGLIYVRCGGVRDVSYTKGIRISGAHQNVSELIHFQRKAEEAIESEKQEREVLKSVASIYHTMYLIDFDKQTMVEINASEEVRGYCERHKNRQAYELMEDIIKRVICTSYLESVLQFTNLLTLKSRMQQKKIISMEAVGQNVGWVRLNFIRISEDADGFPVKVLFAVQVINDEKIREEKLIYISTTDELTGTFNRRAYESEISLLKQNGLKKDIMLVCADLNGLKNVNDTLGHAAGDEVICAAAECLKETLGIYGKVYRVGGDEFAAIVYCNEKQLQMTLDQLDHKVNEWNGVFSQKLSIAKGAAGAMEFPEYSVLDLEREADRRMYENKKQFYSESGIER